VLTTTRRALSLPPPSTAVPTLAYQVVLYNQQKPAVPINLKGILVGNGCLGTEIGICGDDFSANFLNIEQWRGGFAAERKQRRCSAASGSA